MKIIDITESGSNNTLLWAINNDADIKSDVPLHSIINAELFYLVTIEDVNMLELFRLTQTFRDKLRIIKEEQAKVPDVKVLAEKFCGMFLDPDNESNSMPLSEVAEHAITSFMNIALQMNADDDIINPSAVRLFVPMIARSFTIQIPIAFVDVIDSFGTSESADKIFNKQYPSTLRNIIEDEHNEARDMISMIFVKLTSIIKTNPRLQAYINCTKYAMLKKLPDKSLYKSYLTGFHQFDPVTRGEIRCMLFNVNKDAVKQSLTAMNGLKSPLSLEFAVQLPIQQMQLIENMFGPDMLTISCESPMISILDGGLLFNDFVAPEDTNDEPSVDRVNAISAYRTRLTEANQFMLNAIKVLAENGDNDSCSIFSLLPSMYMTNAVITVRVDDLESIIDRCIDLSVREMFTAMLDTAHKIVEDINNSNK